MKLFSSAALLSLALTSSLVSCSMLTDLGGSMAGGAGGGNNAVDMAKNTPVANVLQLPPAAAVGQSWTVDSSGMEKTLAIVAEVDGQLIIEELNTMYGGPVVFAYQVDPSVDLSVVPGPGEKMATNVTAAWFGVEGEKPEEHQVMEAFTMPEAVDAPAAAAVEVKTGTETVSLGGRDWDTTWTEAAGAKTWSAGHFMVRMDYNGSTTTKITAWKTDAKPLLDWAPAAE